MYRYSKESAVGKVLRSQSRMFWRDFGRLKGRSIGIKRSRSVKRIANIKKTFFESGEHKGCYVEEFDMLTRDRKNAYLLFITNKGEFCRFWNEQDMIGGTGSTQHVYTFMRSYSDEICEVRVMVDKDEVLSIKEEDKELYSRLSIARRDAEAVLNEKEQDDESYI